MFAKGPPCIIAGVPSTVCTKFGFIASFNRTAIAPFALRSLAYIGFLSNVYPINMFPSLSLRSKISFDRHNIAITSEAAVMSKPVSRGIPFEVPPRPTTIERRERSFISITRFQEMVLGSKQRLLFLLCMLLSISAERRLCAFSIAAKSPVK